MRAGADTALARVVNVFGQAQAHHAYVFINKRANRMKVLVHDGFGLWLCARRLYEGSFIRASMRQERGMPLSTSSCRHWWWGFRGNGSMSARRSACYKKIVAAQSVDAAINVAA